LHHLALDVAIACTLALDRELRAAFQIATVEKMPDIHSLRQGPALGKKTVAPTSGTSQQYPWLSTRQKDLACFQYRGLAAIVRTNEKVDPC
jgi:hypothetical protein